MMTKAKVKGLYIHIPFCKSICYYCDFYKILHSAEEEKKFVDYLIKELHLKKDYYTHLQTIYIGGGTPSVLSHTSLKKIFKTLQELIFLENIHEFSIELNTRDISTELLGLLKESKINRLSIGIQSFDDEKLRILGRDHNSQEAKQALKLASQAGFENISVDFIYGLADEQFATVKKDISIAKDFNVKHFSIYSLILEPNTKLCNLYKKGLFKRLDDDNDANIYQRMVSFLEEANYMQYEVSNFALQGFESQHNLLYWNNDSFIGVGPSASYYINHTRYTNINNLAKYYQGIDNNDLIFSEEAKLSLATQMLDELIMGLRKVSGIDQTLFFKKYGLTITMAFPNIEKLKTQGFLKVVDDHLFVPQDKLFLLNAILMSII